MILRLISAAVRRRGNSVRIIRRGFLQSPFFRVTGPRLRGIKKRGQLTALALSQLLPDLCDLLGPMQRAWPSECEEIAPGDSRDQSLTRYVQLCQVGTKKGVVQLDHAKRTGKMDRSGLIPRVALGIGRCFLVPIVL